MNEPSPSPDHARAEAAADARSLVRRGLKAALATSIVVLVVFLMGIVQLAASRLPRGTVPWQS